KPSPRAVLAPPSAPSPPPPAPPLPYQPPYHLPPGEFPGCWGACDPAPRARSCSPTYRGKQQQQQQQQQHQQPRCSSGTKRRRLRIRPRQDPVPSAMHRSATAPPAAPLQGIAGFTAHADDNTIRQSVSQFDSQSQLQLSQQQERTRGSFLLQPNTLVSSSVASSAATSAVVVTIGTNVPSAGVNSGLQSQQPPPPPPPSRASLAAALAHTGDGSLSAASWLQPPPPVTPPPPSRNSVPQQQRPEQQQMLTQQLSESYGSEYVVSTLQNMQAEVLAATAKAAAERHQGPTSAEVAAALWRTCREVLAAVAEAVAAVAAAESGYRGGGGSRLNDVRGVLRDGKDGIGTGCRDVREAEPERVSLSPGLRLRLRQDLGTEAAAAAEARGGGDDEGSEKGITLGGGDGGDGDDEDDGGSGGAEEESPPAPPTTPVQLSPPTDAAAEGVTASGDVRDGCGVNRVPQRPSDIAEPPPPPPPPSGLAPVEAPPRGLVEGLAHPANVSGIGGDSITSRRTTDGVTALDADAVPQIPSTGSG
ncbi:hypothetical protein VOLCADRAFT_101411, partial [Volvox carteri f. nagariensis]